MCRPTGLGKCRLRYLRSLLCKKRPNHVEVRTFCRNEGQTMAMKLILSAFCVILLFALAGCASPPSPQAEAKAHVHPLITALKTYHRQTGDYPPQLDDLRPHYLSAEVPFHDWNIPRHSWTVYYQRMDQNNYKLYLNSSPCSRADFVNGTLVATIGPNYQ